MSDTPTDPRVEAAAKAIGHYSCDDCWYSCPLSIEGSCNDNYRDDECICGSLQRADRAVAAADAVSRDASVKHQRNEVQMSGIRERLAADIEAAVELWERHGPFVQRGAIGIVADALADKLIYRDQLEFFATTALTNERLYRVRESAHHDQ